MLTRFEHFAVTEMMGNPDTPPRSNGSLCFSADWERTAFGIALALAKQGLFEWDDFRDELIAEIAAWERDHAVDMSSWHYYDRWHAALEKAVVKTGILTADEMRSILDGAVPDRPDPAA